MRHPDKNNPTTWKKYSNGLCDTCQAICCKMPVEVQFSDLVRLQLAMKQDDPKSVAKHLTQQKIIDRYRHATGKYTLASRADGACVFLDPNDRCSVYEKRPETCRNFPQVSSRSGYCPVTPK